MIKDSKIIQTATSGGYISEIWSVKKDAVYAAISAVESGLEYARECLIAHDAALSRTTYKNRKWAEAMEKDIRRMERTLGMLRACGPDAEIGDPKKL